VLDWGELEHGALPAPHAEEQQQQQHAEPGPFVPGPPWVSESGRFTGVFLISGAEDAKHANPTDGCADLLIARQVALRRRVRRCATRS
jgi:hypothetical protein